MKIIECPRDAMQGIAPFIPTQKKVDYLRMLLRVGFDTLDCGSFVSPKAVPQMRDSGEVLSRLQNDTDTLLLAIVANVRGAEEACRHGALHYVGYPLSLSETFQRRNTNRSVKAAFDDLAAIQERCVQYGKELVVYLSMAFGNPYGDPYDIDVVGRYMSRLSSLAVRTVSLADTVGIAAPDEIKALFETLVSDFSAVEIGVHLHAAPASFRAKIAAAYEAGCRRFDGALKGWGGCPMAEDKLVGNIATEALVDYLKQRGVSLSLDEEALSAALQKTPSVFGESPR